MEGKTIFCTCFVEQKVFLMVNAHKPARVCGHGPDILHVLTIIETKKLQSRLKKPLGLKITTSYYFARQVS